MDNVTDLAFTARVSLQSWRVFPVLSMLLGLVQLLVPSATVMRRSVPSRRLCLQELLPSLTFLHLVEKLARNLLVAARQILISSPPLDDASLLGTSNLIIGL